MLRDGSVLEPSGEFSGCLQEQRGSSGAPSLATISKPGSQALGFLFFALLLAWLGNHFANFRVYLLEC